MYIREYTHFFTKKKCSKTVIHMLKKNCITVSIWKVSVKVSPLEFFSKEKINTTVMI